MSEPTTANASSRSTQMDRKREEVIPCIKMQREEWYQRDDFRGWLARKTLAKWDSDPESEYADCFFSVDYNPDYLGHDVMEGSDFEDYSAADEEEQSLPDQIRDGDAFSPNLPPDIIADIKRVLRERDIAYAIIWLQNCP